MNTVERNPVNACFRAGRAQVLRERTGDDDGRARRAEAPRARCGAATLVVVAATAAYATMTRRFLRGYDRTSYKDEVKTSVATRWPLLWAASPKFREEFRRATRDDDARGEADAESESEAAEEDVPNVPRDIDR